MRIHDGRDTHELSTKAQSFFQLQNHDWRSTVRNLFEIARALICLEQVSKHGHESTSNGSGTGNGDSRSSTLGRSAGSRRSGAGGGVGRVLAGDGDLGVVVGLGVPGVGAGVVVGGGLARIGLLDNVQDTVASRALAVGQRNGPGGRVLGVLASRLGAGVGLVQAQVGNVNIVVDITGLVSDNFEKVGTTVPLAIG